MQKAYIKMGYMRPTLVGARPRYLNPHLKTQLTKFRSTEGPTFLLLYFCITIGILNSCATQT